MLSIVNPQKQLNETATSGAILSFTKYGVSTLYSSKFNLKFERKEMLLSSFTFISTTTTTTTTVSGFVTP